MSQKKLSTTIVFTYGKCCFRDFLRFCGEMKLGYPQSCAMLSTFIHNVVDILLGMSSAMGKLEQLYIKEELCRRLHNVQQVQSKGVGP